MSDELAYRRGLRFNWAVCIAWLLPVAVGLYFILKQGLFAAFAVIPAWCACGVIYLFLSFLQRQPAEPRLATTRDSK
jgi:NCS1 family nucleobase:cation symporter-1